MKPGYYFRVARLHLRSNARPGQETREELARGRRVAAEVGPAGESAYEKRLASAGGVFDGGDVAVGVLPTARPPASLYSCKKYWPPIGLSRTVRVSLVSRSGVNCTYSRGRRTNWSRPRLGCTVPTVPPSPKYPGQPSLTSLPPLAT